MGPRPTSENVLAYVRARQRSNAAIDAQLAALKAQHDAVQAMQDAWGHCKLAKPGLYVFDNTTAVNVDVYHDYPELMEIVKP